MFETKIREWDETTDWTEHQVTLNQTNGLRWQSDPCHMIALYKVGDTSSNLEHGRPP
jgi:hypothetical protein